MNAFILSYFDALIGPSILEIMPRDMKKEDFQLIPDLMNLYENEFFIHIFGNLQTANLIFDISSMGDRGGVMTFQASIASTKGEINEDIARDILEAFQKQVSELTGIQTAIPRRGKPANKQARENLREIMDGVFRSLPGDIVRLHSWDAKVFIFGEASVGKTTILNTLQETVPKATLPTLNMDATKIKVSNLTMTAYDAPGQENLRVLWKPYLKGQDGLVFVLDSTRVDLESLTKSKHLLRDIISRTSMEKLPLLVLFNKNDLSEPDLPTLERELGIT
ncbi:GTP-binding protein, partial [Candidatus Bathyarchaeota archaeon]|nr:GTP-binding protein [Candidatus Bathyarchaeota archaeon]